MKKGNIVCFAMLVAFFMMFCQSIYVNAAEATTSSNVVYLEGDLSNPETYEEELSNLLSDPNVEEVIVMDDSIHDNITSSQPVVQRGNVGILGAVTTYTYRITNVLSALDITGSSIIGSAEGEPGITIGISTTKSISNSYSLSASVVASDTVTTAVGFNVTKAVSVSISGSAPVPSTYNGKAVKSMTLNAYPIYATKTFTIQRHKSIGGINYGWSNYGTGSAKTPKGVSFKKTYVYK